MSALGHLLAVTAYAMAALILAALMPAAETPIGPVSPPLGALALFVACLFLHDQFVRWRQGRERASESRELRHRQSRTEMEIDDLRREIGQLRREGLRSSELIQEKRAAEFEMLRGLLDGLGRHLAPAGPERPGPTADPLPGAEGAPERAPTPGPAEAVEIVRAALEENRVDLYLQPIVSLPQRKVRYYESFSRIRDSEGRVLSPHQYLAAAEDSGLLTAIDNLLLFRCVQLVRRLAKRQPSVGFFINLARGTIEDTEFVDQFAEFLESNGELAANLYFEISQSDLASLSPEGEQALARLGQLGCRFSLDNVTSLVMNFGQLRKRNFRFVKLEAEALLSEVYQSDAYIDVLDLKDLLRRQNIDMIAEKIETEQQVVNLLDFEVDFGQGYLFGGPRRARDDG